VVKEKDIKPPAVMVVGDVVRLRETLNWYEKKPMFGHRILVTREHMEGFERLEDLGAEIIDFPTIEIVPPENYNELDQSIDKVETYNWMIFTSRNGVKYFFKRFFENNRDIRDLKGIKICAIGTKTAQEVGKYGLKVDMVPEEFHAEGLINAFLKEHGAESRKPGTILLAEDGPNAELLSGLRFLLPRAEKAREIFPDKIRELGGEIDVPAAYRTMKPEYYGKRLRRFLKEGRITIATFTSAATFSNLLEIMGDDAEGLLKGVTIAVIGPVTAKAVEKAGLSVSIMPETATIDAMVEEIIKWSEKRKIDEPSRNR